MDHSPSGFSVDGILQVRILEWFAISFSKGSSQPRDRNHISYVSCIDRRVFKFVLRDIKKKIPKIRETFHSTPW